MYKSQVNSMSEGLGPEMPVSYAADPFIQPTDPPYGRLTIPPILISRPSPPDIVLTKQMYQPNVHFSPASRSLNIGHIRLTRIFNTIGRLLALTVVNSGWSDYPDNCCVGFRRSVVRLSTDPRQQTTVRVLYPGRLLALTTVHITYCT